MNGSEEDKKEEEPKSQVLEANPPHDTSLTSLKEDSVAISPQLKPEVDIQQVAQADPLLDDSTLR